MQDAEPYPLRDNTCAGCGFLALEPPTPGDLVSATEAVRVEGSRNTTGFEGVPVCAVRAISLPQLVHDEYRSLQANGWQEDKGALPSVIEVVFEIRALQTVLRQPRHECAFVRWNPLLTPKEHREMLDRQWMREQEEKRLESDRRWQKGMRREERKWRKSQRKEERIWRVVDLAILGVLVSGATLIAGAVGGGWSPSWWPF